jgi:hypothetical protein
MGEMGNTFDILVGKPKGNDPVVAGRRIMNNLKKGMV